MALWCQDATLKPGRQPRLPRLRFAARGSRVRCMGIDQVDGTMQDRRSLNDPPKAQVAALNAPQVLHAGQCEPNSTLSGVASW